MLIRQFPFLLLHICNYTCDEGSLNTTLVMNIVRIGACQVLAIFSFAVTGIFKITLNRTGGASCAQHPPPPKHGRFERFPKRRNEAL